MTPAEHDTLEQIQATMAGVHAELKRLNGSVARHETHLGEHHVELHGDTARQIPGIKTQVLEFHDLVVGLKAQGRLIAAIGAVLTVLQGAVALVVLR